MSPLLKTLLRAFALLALAASLRPTARAPASAPARAHASAVGRRDLVAAGVGALASLTAAPALADGYGGNATEFDAAAYFGIFSCEGWGQQRMPGSNSCMPKPKS